MQNGNLSRRKFLAQSCCLSAGVITAGALSSCVSAKHTAIPVGKVIGANERINLALVGIRSRGWQLAEGFMDINDVHIKTLCDIDGNVLNNRAGELEKKKGYRPQTCMDFRQALADPQIDAVVFGTPNHWHALGAIWACQAGKHVYVEKPACYNVFEGRKMVEAARKYNRLVQVGFQNRSIGNVRRAIEFLHSGGIGDVYMARGLCYKERDSIGSCKDGIGTGKDYEYYVFNKRAENYTAEYMKNVDYDMWTGPAPLLPFNYNRFHYNWHWNWLYGGGDIANQGPHQFDVARWGLNKNEHPVKVSSQGGYFGKKCDQQTPNTQTATIEYADGKLLVFEVRGLYANQEQGINIGNLFYGTKGWMYINGSDWASFLGRKNEPGPGSKSGEESADPTNPAGAGGEGHFANFIRALRSGKQTDLNAEIKDGYMSSALPLLANISYRLGRTLTFDGAKEKFIGDRGADKMLTRKYRKPYIVPERV